MEMQSILQPPGLIFSQQELNRIEKRPPFMYPILYHAHHSLHLEDIPMWLALAKQNPGPILELGCGTGRVTLPLMEVADYVCGIDYDFQMLSFLRKQLNSKFNSNRVCFQADITCFHLKKLFSLILLPCNTYSGLTKDERLSVLRQVNKHLKPGGVFVVSMPNPDLFWQLPAESPPELEEEIPHPLDNGTVQIHSGWERTKDVFIVNWHYDQLFSNGEKKRISAQAKHQLVSADTYLKEMKENNLNIQELYGEYDFSIFTPDSLELIILATH
jgi:SAM-dependent methyltransferase